MDIANIKVVACRGATGEVVETQYMFNEPEKKRVQVIQEQLTGLSIGEAKHLLEKIMDAIGNHAILQ